MLNISEIIDAEYATIEAKLVTVNGKIATTSTNRRKLITRKERLEEKLSKLKAIRFQSDTFNQIEE